MYVVYRREPTQKFATRSLECSDAGSTEFVHGFGSKTFETTCRETMVKNGQIVGNRRDVHERTVVTDRGQVCLY